MRAAVVYWSRTGNTEKVARTIEQALRAGDVEITCHRVEDAVDLDWFGYDLLCLGFPSYHWSPPAPVSNWLKDKVAAYRGEGRVKVGAPQIPGKHVLIFCTYSGPHTGIDEAVPAAQYAGQFFAHLGLKVLDEWYVVGEFHGSLENSTQGRLGDIRGRPSDEDLEQIERDTHALLEQIRMLST